MKALCSFGVLCSLALATTCFAGEGIPWEKDLDAAKSAAKRSNRLVLIHFGAPWCKACQQLERDVFSAPEFGKELKPDYVAIKLNVDNFPATARQYGVGPIPCDVILAPNGQVIEHSLSPLDSAEYIAGLQRVAVYARTGKRPLPPQVAGAASAGALAPETAPAGSLNAAGGAARANAANPGQGENTYMNYYNQQRTGNAAPPTAQPYLTANTPAVAAANAAVPQSTGQTDWLAAQTPGAQPGQVSQKPAQTVRSTPQIPPGNPPLALEGCCSVSLVERPEKEKWQAGDIRYGMQHRGKTYLFAGPEELARFRVNPDRYAPAFSGNDPVLEVDQHQSVPGSLYYGLFCRGHIYLFSSEETLHRFRENQERYVPDLQQARR